MRIHSRVMCNHHSRIVIGFRHSRIVHPVCEDADCDCQIDAHHMFVVAFHIAHGVAPFASFFFGARIWLGTILGQFSINYFSGLGLRIRVRVWVRVRARVWVRVSVGVGVRVSVVIWLW